VQKLIYRLLLTKLIGIVSADDLKRQTIQKRLANPPRKRPPANQRPFKA
jgi:hypothetical protein